MLKYLGVSRSGYHAWKKRVPLNTTKRREAVKANIIVVQLSRQKSKTFIMNG